eukprot:scaffold131121_cov13-Tisochrysis_lutea.AAC.1
MPCQAKTWARLGTLATHPHTCNFARGAATPKRPKDSRQDSYDDLHIGLQGASNQPLGYGKAAGALQTSWQPPAT